ncbi:hypothetical protein FG386_003448 [Cryptosporidium ryanae]|uniref:uncharacterized protein n=1 Tax=Cryptosporidium ryanae TaxID=515981 RepID=UPI00351A206D|nr:hypothetical protein FG386_003448 [Cryptosporidium ryanae]
MELFSENSKHINDIKALTREADDIIQQHQQLVELDLNLNINRESLSAIRRGCYPSLSDANGSRSLHCNLEEIKFSKFETSNKLLRLGDFFISTTPYVIHKYLLSEKRALEELIYTVRVNRYEKIDKFLKLHPDIPEEYLSDIKFIIKDTKRDKPHIYSKTENTVQLKTKYNNSFINFIPKFSVFEPENPDTEHTFGTIDDKNYSRELDFNSSSYCFYDDVILRNNFRSNKKEVLLFLYNHGFPDYTIKYNSDTNRCLRKYECEFNTKDSAVEKYCVQELEFQEDLLELTRFPTKMRDMCLSNIGDYVSNTYNTIFVTFNTNGILGSECGDFYEKTLVKDMNDIETVVNYFCDLVYSKSKLIMIGLSTGAFLTFSYSTNYTKRGSTHYNKECSDDCFNCKCCRSNYFISNPNLIGIVCIACVDDIPSSYDLDFTSDQLNEFNSNGFCTVNSNVPFVGGNRLSVEYLNSYSHFPSYRHLHTNRNRIINVPILLVHGTDDMNVPFNMSINLIGLNNNGNSPNPNYRRADSENCRLEDSKSYIFNYNKDLLDSLILEIKGQHHTSFAENKTKKEKNDIKLYVLDKGNHLVTNTKHMKKVQNAISLFVLQVLNDLE